MMQSILLVTDDTDLVRQITTVMEAEGWRVVSVDAIYLARVAWGLENFSVILAGGRFGEETGTQLFQMLRKHRGNMVPRLIFMVPQDLGDKITADIQATGRPAIGIPFNPTELPKFLAGHGF